jgi:molecular chaperone DnaK
MRVLGIDFGTSNTVGMVRTPDGRVRPLLFDGSPLLPSAVYLNTDGRMLIGRDAERNARLDPSRFEPNPKRRIDDGQIFLGDAEIAVPRVFGSVLGQVAGEARRQLGAPPDEVRMTHPARWGERRRSLLVEAARLAGLRAPRLIAEPVGAASYFTAVLGSAVPIGRCLAIYDLGGGTFDATVVRRTQTGFEVLAEEGLADVGGLDFDHAIVEHLGTTYRASHPESWARLANPTDAGDRRQRRMLYEDVRGAKEMLSRTSSADIHLPALEVDAHLTREELDTLIRPYLEQTVACLQRALDAARLTPQQLVGIFLVGGSSRIPLAAHLIHSALGVAPTTLEQPETVVVEGALCIGAAVGSGGAVSGVPRPVQPAPPRPAAPLRPVSTPPARPVSTPPARPVSTPPARPVSPPVGQPVVARPPAPAATPAPQPVRQMPPAAGPVSAPAQPPQVHRPPVSAPPVSPAAPVMSPATGPATPPPGLPANPRPNRPPPMPPRMAPRVAPPVTSPPPVARPVPAPQQQRPAPRPTGNRERPWYNEPSVIATVIVLVLIGIAFVVLLATAL